MDAIVNMQLATARAEADAARGWLLSAIGTFKRIHELKDDGHATIRAEMIADAIDQARAAINRFEDLLRVGEAA